MRGVGCVKALPSAATLSGVRLIYHLSQKELKMDFANEHSGNSGKTRTEEEEEEEEWTSAVLSLFLPVVSSRFHYARSLLTSPGRHLPWISLVAYLTPTGGRFFVLVSYLTKKNQNRISLPLQCCRAYRREQQKPLACTKYASTLMRGTLLRSYKIPCTLWTLLFPYINLSPLPGMLPTAQK